MKKLIYEARLGLFTWIMSLIVYLVPNEATKTLIWLTKMPLED